MKQSLKTCLPLGEGAERSEAEGGCAPQLNIVPVSSNFPVPKGHNANFVWNQDEVPQNSLYAKRFCYSSRLIAQTVATLLWFHTLIC